MKQILKTIVYVTFIVAISTKLSAQTPWKCSGKAIGTYNPLGNSYTDDTKLYTANFDASGNVTYINKPATTGIGLNGIGFRPQDNFVYGVRYTNNNGKNNELCRIDSSGTIVSLGAISGLKDDVQYFAGGFDSKGYLYVSSGSGSTPYYLYKIDVTALTATNVGSIGDYRLVDLAFDPLTDSLYASSSNVNSNGGNLINIDITANPITISDKGTMDVFMFGLFFADGAQLYGFGRQTDNSTAYFKIDKTNAGLTNAGAGPSATNADACSCPFTLSQTLAATSNCVNPGQNTTLTATITNLSSAKQNATFDLTLDKRFSFTQTSAQIQSYLQSLFPGSTAVVTLSNDSNGVNNKISINTIAVPITTSTAKAIPFDLAIKVNPAYYSLGEIISFQSTVNVPGNSLNTGAVLSDNPLTAQLNDATTLSICLPEAGPLPVTITDFNGQVNENNANLSWNTKEEINLKNYEIERSTNGSDFVKVGTVSSKGNNQTENSYQFEDVNVSNLATTLYYRMKMIDMNGNYKYSPIVVLKFNGLKGQIMIYPSPFIDKINVNISTEINENVTIILTDALGRRLISKTVAVENGDNAINLDNLSYLQKGMYFITIYQGQQLLENKKIIKIQ